MKLFDLNPNHFINLFLVTDVMLNKQACTVKIYFGNEEHPIIESFDYSTQAEAFYKTLYQAMSISE